MSTDLADQSVGHERAMHSFFRTVPSLLLNLALWLAVGLRVQAATHGVVVPLWPGEVPKEQGIQIGKERERMSPGLDRKQVEVVQPTRMITDVTQPSITLYRPAKARATGTTVVICPGGGYWDLYWQLEGEEVADWLNSMGVTAAILKYRVPRRPDEVKGEPAGRPLQDAQRAIRLLRARAAEWGVATNRIGVVGFSAGGHLAIATATRFETATYPDLDDADRMSCRPDFAIAAYSGYLKAKDRNELSDAIKIPAGTPPIFLVHGGEDLISPPEGSVLMYLALKRAGASAELHIYSDTTHDFGVRREEGRSYSSWTTSCERWMRNHGWLE